MRWVVSFVAANLLGTVLSGLYRGLVLITEKRRDPVAVEPFARWMVVTRL
jgi:hypothetical protein